jgi:MFS family permease
MRAIRSLSDSIGIGRLRCSYGWLLVALMFLNALLIQGTALGGIVMFDDKIIDALGVSRGVLKFRDFIYILATSSFAFAMAWICERIGIKTTIMLGLVGLSGVFIGYSMATNIATIYLLQVLLGFSFASIHVVVVMIVLTRWFPGNDPRRGIALGISVSGASFGAVVISQFTAILFGLFDWRTVFQVLAIGPLLLLPLVWLIVRPPREEGNSSWNLQAGGRFGFSFSMLCSRGAIMLMISIIPVFYVSACIGSHVVLMLRDQGLSVQVAATGVSAMFLSGLVGKFTSGFLLLRIRLFWAWLCLMMLMLAGSVLLVTVPTVTYIEALVLIGFGWGGCFPIAQLRIAEYFPGPALPRILGVFVLFESVGSAGGAWLTAVLFDMTGSYNLAFIMNTGLLVLGLVATLSLRGRTQLA